MVRQGREFRKPAQNPQKEDCGILSMKLSLVAKYTLLLFAGVVLGVRAQAVYAHEGPDAGQSSATVSVPCGDISQGRVSATATEYKNQGSAAATADQGAVQMTTDTYQLLYRLDEVSIDRSYLSNKDNIAKIVDHLQRSERIDSIAIYAYASPEGVYEHNLMLARRRAEAAKRFILSNLPDDKKQNPPHIILHPVAENWAGLRLAVEQNYHRADREKVLAIIDDPTISDDTREWRLKNRLSPESWNYIRRNLLPELRLATWVCVWQALPEQPEPEQPLERQDVAITPAQAPVITLPQPPVTLHDTVVTKFPKTVFALKTNLLYDAVTALNLSLEVPLVYGLSLNTDFAFPWWNAGPYGNKYAMQVLSAGAQLRWWFAPQPKYWNDTKVRNGFFRQRDALTGHFAALGASAGKFDIQWGRNFGCYQCYFKEISISYGYSFPVSKHLNMEFELSMGYMGIDFQHYIPTDNWEVLLKDNNKAGTLHYWGPTRLQVSLVYPILVKRRK